LGSYTILRVTNFGLKKSILKAFNNQNKIKMKTFKKNLVYLLLPALLTGMSVVFFSCSKDDTKTTTPAYVCASCHDTPDALAVYDANVRGIYKGIVVGSTGSISIDIQNGSSTITATMVLDGTSIALTSMVGTVDGQSYVAPFTGTYNGSPISITFSVGLGGTAPTVVTSDIPGHPNAAFQIYKETSTSLIEAFQGTYSKPGQSGVFNVILSRALAKWGGVAKENGGTENNEVSGTINASNQLIEENGTNMATISGDVLTGSFSDGNGATVTIQGTRTL